MYLKLVFIIYTFRAYTRARAADRRRYHHRRRPSIIIVRHGRRHRYVIMTLHTHALVIEIRGA